MPRPVKVRKVEFIPEETYFKPMGKKKCEVEEVILKVEELEAIRLKDMEQLSQEEGASRMGVSRQTYQNILDEARRKITIALVEGKAICIGGGNFAAKSCLFKCSHCQEVYEINYQMDRKRCPKCGSSEVGCSQHKGRCENCLKGVDRR